MTDCSVYIGSLEDPNFKWDGGDWNGNCPKSLSPSFPPMSQAYNGDFHDWVAKARVECKQTDFAGWVAKVTKSQIREFVKETYQGKEDLPWVKGELIELDEFISSLDENRTYALVANEW